MSHTTKRKNLDFIIALLFGAMAFITIIWFNYNNPHLVVRYDCSIAEISPDYPIEVKEGCRKLRAKYFQEELKKPK